MLDIVYVCQDCDKVSPKDYHRMVCKYCGGKIKGTGGPSISGTRDGFGISKSFKDEETGQEIDTWKKWEKAGYRDPVEVTKNHAVKEKIKEKIKKRKNS